VPTTAKQKQLETVFEQTENWTEKKTAFGADLLDSNEPISNVRSFISGREGRGNEFFIYPTFISKCVGGGSFYANIDGKRSATTRVRILMLTHFLKFQIR